MERKDLRKLIIVVSLVAVLAIAVPLGGGCFPRAEAPPPEAPPPEAPPAEVVPIKIGVLAALSGPMTDLGTEMLQGIDLAVKEVNEAGGILGRPVETAVVDTKDYMDECPVEAVDELVLKHDVLFITGGIATSVGWPARERAVSYGVPYLSIAPSDSMATRGENLCPYNLATYPDTEVVQWCLWPYVLANDLVSKDIVLMAPDYEWGWANNECSRKPIEAFGGNIVAEILTPLPTVKMGPYIAKIEDLLPEGGTIMASHAGADTLELFKEVYAAGLLDKGYDFIQTDVYHPSGYRAIGQQRLQGVWVIQAYYPYLPGDQAHTEFIKRWVAEYGADLPGVWMVHNYLMVLHAAEVMNKVGSLDKELWFPEIIGHTFTGTITDGGYTFQAHTGRLLWPIVLMRGKAPEDMVDIYPTIDELGPEWDCFNVIHTFDDEYQLGVVPEEATLEGVEIGGPGIGDGVMHYYK